MSVSEVNDYYFLLRAAWAEYPILRLVWVATDLQSASVNAYAVWSEHAPILDAWSRGSVFTGDPQVDSVFQGNGAATVARAMGDVPIFGVGFPYFTNWRTLRPLVESIPNTVLLEEEIPPDALPARCNNILLLERTADSATLRYDLGWGDCFTGAYFQHRFLVTVEDAGTTSMTDLGGDPIPMSMLEYAEGAPVPPLE